MATHSSILAWRIPLTEEPGGLQSMAHTEWGMTEVTAQEHTHTHQYSCLGNPVNRGAWWGTVPEVTKESDMI